MHHLPMTQAFTYGLAGTELRRATERRTAERQRDAIAAALRQPSRVTLMRQRLGDAMIRTGANIAGESSSPRRAVAAIRPTTDLA